MKEFVAFLLPPATALAGTRVSRLILGKQLDETFAFGFRFALGLAVGMLVFSQSLLFAALLGAGLSGFLAWTALVWGLAEAVLLAPKIAAGLRQMRFQPAHLWLLTLLPVVCMGWEIARLSVLDGTQEFDASAFWLIKARILYFDQGKNLLSLIHSSNLAYAHMDYPLLVPCLYTLNYGALGGIDEFVIKVWPFWMVVALCAAIFSLARVWRQPRPPPILLVVFFCFLPATGQFIRQEGGTIPLLFGASMAALLFVTGLIRGNETSLAAGVLVLACCAMTKFEGIIYTALWGTVISVFCWRRGWLKNRVIWKAILVAAVCLVPYFCYRLTKPVLHPESTWMHTGAAAPGAVLNRFPQTLFLSFGHRFFNPNFFHWETADKDHLRFAGQWLGLDSFVGPELSLLPWLLLPLVGLSFWKKPAYRTVLGALLAVIIGELVVLSLAISCLPRMQSDLSEVIDFTGEIVGRYYYPFFTACFLGVMILWLLDGIPRAISISAAAKPNPIPESDFHERQ